MSGYHVISGERTPIKAWTKGVQVEEAAERQLRNIANMPFIHRHVAAMPDVHWGMGATVGSVIATKGAIIPAAVGVDIGCGMAAVRTNLKANDLPDSLLGVRLELENAIPHGRTDNGGDNDRGAWGDIPRHVMEAFQKIRRGLDFVIERNGKIKSSPERAAKHLGTLGTGNHFVEVCLDEKDDVWIMLHSGSRGIGNQIGQRYIELAKEEMKRWFINLPDDDLAYIPEGSKHFDDYLDAVNWAQEFAELNRAIMMEAALSAVSKSLGREVFITKEAVNCHHNYVSRENHFGANVLVTRKGAVRARTTDLGIIPGSMGAKSFIVRGKGNPDSFCSCSHGAGRKMSRAEAKRKYTVEDHIVATNGVECRKDADVIDETPMAYKDIDAVMSAQSDLVEIVHTLKQVICVKG